MIQIENLTFHYRKEKPIIREISTTLQPGHIYGLLGLNGEGKTTFLKLLAGLIFPKTGYIRLNNNLPTTKRSYDFFEHIYMLPDHPTSPNLKIAEFVRIYSPFYKKFSLELFSNALKDLNVDFCEKIKSLSLGQQKKFHLAFALATNTSILLLDEPTNGLDIPSKNAVRKLLAKEITENKTILISTHLIKDIENLIDHLLILKNGEMVVDSHVLEILKKYNFSQSRTPVVQSLYTEQHLSVYRNILVNKDDSESNLDIELFFNAIQHEKI